MKSFTENLKVVYERVMKQKILILLIMGCFVQIFTVKVFSQSKTLQLNLHNVAIEEVINVIEQKTAYRFLFNKDVVDVRRKVSVVRDKIDVPGILDLIFRGTDVSYSINGKQIVLSRKDKKITDKSSGKISGTITDEKGVPLIGVNIHVKGTAKGTITDNEGRFEVEATYGTKLVVSYIGYASQEISITNNVSYNIKLQEDSKSLSEVVVVGYGSQKKVNLTGAVSSVNKDVLETRPVQNVGQALQGIVPGLNFGVGGYGGELNQNLSFNIRGVGTIGAGSTAAPLVLIDGVEGDMNALNPQDIDNISVLKDAASSAIYGSRAAFGVILITTKTGKQGKTVVNYNNTFKFSSPTYLPKMMDSYSFAEFFNDAQINGGGAAVFSDLRLDQIKKYQAGEITTGTSEIMGGIWKYYTKSNANVDWIRELYKNSFSQEHNISANGGTEKLQYYVSGSFLDQNGILRYSGDQFKRYTFTTKLSSELSKFVKFNYMTKFVREDYEEATHQDWTFFYNIYRRWPTNPVKDPNGHYTDQSEIPQLLDGGRRKTRTDWLYNQGQLVISPLNGLNIYAEANYRITNNNNHTDVLPAYAYDANGAPFAIPVNGNPAGYTYVGEYNRQDNFLTSNLYSDYVFDIRKDHHFKVILGFNSELMNTRYFSASNTGLITRDLTVLDLATDNNKIVGGSAGHWSTSGFFGRLNYNYKERYLLELNARYDGTSRFIEEKRWNIFPSISAGWNIAKENFWKFQDAIQLFKLRASYGELGNQNTSNWYPFYPSMPITPSGGSWLINGAKPNVASAPGLISSSLTWERVKSWDLGLDLGMLKNRLNISLGLFNRITSNMVGPAPELPVILGTGVPQVNNAEMKSYGFDVEAKWQDRIGSLKYSVRAVLADDQQKIMSYPNTTGNIYTWYNGQKMNDIWGYTTIGIAKTQAEMNAHLATVSQNNLATQWGAGDIMYADLNHDGKIDGGSGILGDTGDRKVIGNSTPRYRFSLDLDASWKNFDIRVLFQGVGKRDWMPSGAYFWGADGAAGIWSSDAFLQHQNYFRDETTTSVVGGVNKINLDSYYPKPYFNTNKNQLSQTRYLQNAAYIRLKNVQIGYNVPLAILSKIGVSKFRIYVTAENLLTITKLSNILDPEVLGLNGVDGRVYPLSRVTALGLSVNF